MDEAVEEFCRHGGSRVYSSAFSLARPLARVGWMEWVWMLRFEWLPERLDLGALSEALTRLLLAASRDRRSDVASESLTIDVVQVPLSTTHLLLVIRADTRKILDAEIEYAAVGISYLNLVWPICDVQGLPKGVYRVMFDWEGRRTLDRVGAAIDDVPPEFRPRRI